MLGSNSPIGLRIPCGVDGPVVAGIATKKDRRLEDIWVGLPILARRWEIADPRRPREARTTCGQLGNLPTTSAHAPALGAVLFVPATCWQETRWVAVRAATIGWCQSASAAPPTCEPEGTHDRNAALFDTIRRKRLMGSTRRAEWGLHMRATVQIALAAYVAALRDELRVPASGNCTESCARPPRRFGTPSPSTHTLFA